MMTSKSEPSMTPRQFVEQVRPLLPGLRSALLYGSSAAGDFIPGSSTHDLLLIADRWTVEELNALQPAVQQWRRAGHPIPQLFTVAEFASVADVFPIEVLDLQQAREVLFGEDAVAPLNVDPDHLRLQLEHELRSKLLFLRQQLLSASGDSGRTAGVLLASLSTFLVLFRAALRLYDKSVPAWKRLDLVELARHVAFDPGPFDKLLEHKERRHLKDHELAALADRYLSEVEIVVAAVDRHLRKANREGQT